MMKTPDIIVLLACNDPNVIAVRVLVGFGWKFKSGWQTLNVSFWLLNNTTSTNNISMFNVTGVSKPALGIEQAEKFSQQLKQLKKQTNIFYLNQH